MLVCVALTAAGSTLAAAETAPPPIGPHNTGVADTKPGDYRPPAAGVPRVKAKEQMAANIEKGRPALDGVDADAAGLSDPMVVKARENQRPSTTEDRAKADPSGRGSAPEASEARAASSYYIPMGHYWQEKTYTCGPASARNLIRSMAGVDETEPRLEALMGTTPQLGTYINRIAGTLNDRYYNYDYFALTSPASPSALLASTQNIVGNYGHGMITNVQTNRLWFWNGMTAQHYNVVYGWNYQNIYLYDQYNTAHLGFGGPNPGGFWQISSTNLYNAVQASPTRQYVG